MLSTTDYDVGFDVDAAIRLIHEAALSEGVTPRGDWRAKDPFNTALVHAFAHGPAVGACTKTPCRLGGLCLALYELTTFRLETGARAPIVQAADETEKVGATLAEVAAPYARAVVSLLRAAHEHRELEIRSGLATPSRAVRIATAPGQILEEFLALIAKLDGSLDDLRGLLESKELKQPATDPRQRRQLLVVAVTQHLHWGGLHRREIAGLVPDHAGVGKVDARALDRVRKRWQEPDARLICPGPLPSSRVETPG